MNGIDVFLMSTERETSNGRSSPAAGGENGCREEMEAKGEEEGEEEEEEEENVQFNEDLLCSHGEIPTASSSSIENSAFHSLLFYVEVVISATAVGFGAVHHIVTVSFDLLIIYNYFVWQCTILKQELDLIEDV